MRRCRTPRDPRSPSPGALPGALPETNRTATGEHWSSTKVREQRFDVDGVQCHDIRQQAAVCRGTERPASSPCPWGTTRPPRACSLHRSKSSRRPAVVKPVGGGRDQTSRLVKRRRRRRCGPSPRRVDDCTGRFWVRCSRDHRAEDALQQVESDRRAAREWSCLAEEAIRLIVLSTPDPTAQAQMLIDLSVRSGRSARRIWSLAERLITATCRAPGERQLRFRLTPRRLHLWLTLSPIRLYARPPEMSVERVLSDAELCQQLRNAATAGIGRDQLADLLVAQDGVAGNRRRHRRHRRPLIRLDHGSQ
jgi:hypothetical protein